MISLSFGHRPDSHSLSLTLTTQWPFSQVAINEWAFLIDDDFTLASALGGLLCTRLRHCIRAHFSCSMRNRGARRKMVSFVVFVQSDHRTAPVPCQSKVCFKHLERTFVMLLLATSSCVIVLNDIAQTTLAKLKLTSIQYYLINK